MTNELTLLIEKIQSRTDPSLTMEEISERIGYSREHISRMKKKPPASHTKLIAQLKEKFKKVLVEETVQVNVELNKVVKDLVVQQEKTAATVDVLLSMVAELEINSTGRPLADVQFQIEKAVNDRLSNRFEKLKTKQ